MFKVLRGEENNIGYLEKVLSKVREETAIINEMYGNSRKRYVAQLVHEMVVTVDGPKSAPTLRTNCTEQVTGRTAKCTSEIVKLVDGTNYNCDVLEDIVGEAYQVINESIMTSAMFGETITADDIAFKFNSMFTEFVISVGLDERAFIPSVVAVDGEVKEISITIC